MPLRSDIGVNWHKSGNNYQNYKMKQICVIPWNYWRTRQESNLRPSLPQTVLAGIQGQTATKQG